MSEETKPERKTLAELIAPFRDDAQDNAVVILGDDEAVRVLSAFRMVEHRWSYPRAKPPANASKVATWKWLTSTWRIDTDELARAAGLSEETAQSKLDVLLANRLIYPDGTISKGANFALQSHSMTKLGLKPKRSDASKNTDAVKNPSKENGK
jgi:hypothetical protein